MLRDWGSRDPRVHRAWSRGCERRRAIWRATERMSRTDPGSGTFAVEAAIGTLVPPSGKVLVLVNGAYGRRMVKIAGGSAAPSPRSSRRRTRPSAADVDAALAGDPAISHVAVVHCETTSGHPQPRRRNRRGGARAPAGAAHRCDERFGALSLGPGSAVRRG